MSSTCQGGAQKPRVFLWAIFRSLSTAFERSIRNLKNGKVFHEPHLAAYYHGPERTSKRFSNTAIDPRATYDAVRKELSDEHEGFDFVFAKDQALYLEGKFDILRQEGFQHFNHTFLIRHPKKVVKSYYHACINGTETPGFDTFVPNEISFRHSLDLHDFVVNELKSTPVIIDADDLLDSPEEIMQMYCNATGLTYEENMTSWENAAVPDWIHGDGWYGSVLRSKGLSRQVKSDRLKENLSLDYERDVAEVLEDNLECYKKLYEQRLHLSS